MDRDIDAGKEDGMVKLFTIICEHSDIFGNLLLDITSFEDPLECAINPNVIHCYTM